MPQAISIVNAFAAPPYLGNSAGVCVLSGPKPASWMQSIAAKVKLSETAFVWHARDGWSLRWFTPTVEVDLCGHATMASAFVLWRQRCAPAAKPIRFYTASGILKANKSGRWITLDFPAIRSVLGTIPKEVRALSGTRAISFARTKELWIVEFRSEAAVREFKPNFKAIRQLPTAGVAITSRSESDRFDFVSRCFFPKEGINEDPATGSAHCALALFWRHRLGRDRLAAFQASNRGGVIRVRLIGGRVKLSGRCIPAEGKRITV